MQAVLFILSSSKSKNLNMDILYTNFQVHNNQLYHFPFTYKN